MTKTVAIIGGGVIGGGWAARFLLNGWTVNLFDPDPDSARKIAEVLENARHALPMLYDVALPAEGTLHRCPSIAMAVANADWVQESVPERLDLKHKVLAEIEAHAPAATVIGSSTSGFKPSQLQENAVHPGRILVTHPFNPVYLLPVVELVPSPQNASKTVDDAQETLTHLGMHPIRIRKEIDAHVADRLLEAVWREALWLVHDGVATTQEIDDLIRYGFGLRWAQMGLFETYRIAGGEAGMRHFIEQFGPCLAWPWTKLMDVPELTDDLIDRIADQSDAQSGDKTIRELERLRDDNLVAIMRALKGKTAAVGAVLDAHQHRIAPARPAQGADAPLETIRRTVPSDWTDQNGHMNESRYGQVFSDAADQIMKFIGADEAYIASGYSYFTVDIHIRFLQETIAGQKISVYSRVLSSDGKKLRLYHEITDADGVCLATGEQFLLHVSLTTRTSCPPAPDILQAQDQLAAAQAHLPWPDHVKR
ncbi:MAG: carnitine 3-dehydrogenase [Marinosulfonomonas sp.]